MKTKLFLLSSLFSVQAFSQVTLEHTYTTSALGEDKFFSAFHTQTELNHFTFNKNTRNVQIFNQGHSQASSFTIPVTQDWTITDFLFVTDNLFNNDSNIEFLVSEYNGLTNDFKIVLVSSNGSVIQEFSGASYAGIFKDSTGQYKLITKSTYSGADDYLADLKVYALPGTLTVNQQEMLSKNAFAFPNPTDGQIMFQNLKLDGEKGKLEVFNASGMKVLQKELSENETNTAIDTSALSSGVYIYKVNGKSGKFIKK